MKAGVRPERVRDLNRAAPATGPILYWMSRDQRATDNWALLYARELAMASRQPLAVVFCLVPGYLGARGRQYRFMLAGLAETAARLERLNITFHLLRGDPGEALSRFAAANGAGAVVTDFSPLRLNRSWKRDAAARLRIPLREVDAHNIVPAWIASDKQEYGAYTIRPKIERLLGDYLEEFPVTRPVPHPWPAAAATVDWEAAATAARAGPPVDAGAVTPPGEKAGRRRMRRFLEKKLPAYAGAAGDPAKDGQSGLSPYLHFGQLSAQRLALEAIAHGDDVASLESFLEQLIVRRELADNFCLYNPDYDQPAGFPRWSRETLAAHAGDRREYLYSLEELEAAATHDELWNAAQMEMVKAGRMHGYLRMYWAKKILEWTSGAAEAMEHAIGLNDRYQLDGRDPNGYAGIAWSIGGVHDRAWGERPVFGKVRYMNYNGARSRFDIAAYLRMVDGL
ncbi:MAG: deoxyribodipyrimidine photo-lyase [Thermoleophilia bacterium]